MRITVVVEIDKEEYQSAMCDGWNDRYNEDLKPEDFTNFENPEDFQNAAAGIPLESFVSVSVSSFSV